jgi:cytochrome c553
MEKLRSFEMRAKAELSELTSAIRDSDHDHKTSLTQFASSRGSPSRSSPSLTVCVSCHISLFDHLII